MSRESRIKLIRKIERQRGSRVLVYITGDRSGLETKISPDTFPFIAKHLVSFKNPEKIDLLLYSTGGVTMAGYSLVNMIREYAPSLGVLIPFKALSCATLIALGADDIVMTKMGQLSPIDPSFQHPLAPVIQVPGQIGPVQPLPVSVEDIFNYLDLIRNELKITEIDDMSRILEKLSTQIHPIVLGHSYRLREQTSFLADSVLSFHMTNKEAKKRIIDLIIKGRYSHDYIFSRKEVKEIVKLPVQEDPQLEKTLMAVFSEYQDFLELANPYNAEAYLGAAEETTQSFNRAIIESTGLTHIFKTERLLTRKPIELPGTKLQVPQVLEKLIKEGWVEDNNP